MSGLPQEHICAHFELGRAEGEGGSVVGTTGIKCHVNPNLCVLARVLAKKQASAGM